MIDRRLFLKSSGLALLGTALTPNVFVRMASAATPSSGRTLVAIFLRGAVDGLNAVVPIGDPFYAKSRPTIAIAPPRRDDGVLDLDGFFGLHPALASLAPHYRDRSLAFVHAAGSPDATRSHFDAQHFMECGTPGKKTTKDGFLARAMKTKDSTSALRSVAIAAQPPQIFAGASGSITISDISRFGVHSAAAASGFASLYANTGDTSLGVTASEAFEAEKILRAKAPQKLLPQNGAVYPRGTLGDSLRQIAQLIRSNVGLEIAFTEGGSWDTHAGQGGARGQLANNLKVLGDAVHAFMADLGSRMNDVTLVTMSEFGRTVRENGNRGTDHGHGGFMLLAGGGVRGGNVHGKWPGLAREALHEGRDLAITTDYRDVFAEVLRARMNVHDLATVFPGHRPRPVGAIEGSRELKRRAM